jgi:hypothetical protein
MSKMVDSITESAELLSGSEIGLLGRGDRHRSLHSLAVSFQKSKGGLKQ